MLEPLDPVTYHRDVLPPLLAGERGVAAARDLTGVGPLTLVVDGHPYTYRAVDGIVAVSTGDPDADDRHTVVELSTPAWSDLALLLRSVPALALAGELTFTRGGFGHLSRWEPALRCLYAGIPIYDPARADLDGVDLGRTFAFADADDAEMGAHLALVGFLHVRGVFTADEIAALNAEVDRLAAAAAPGDGRSWWATDVDDNDVLCRLVYAGTESERIAALAGDRRLTRLLALSPYDLVTAPDRMEGESVLLKNPGELKGLSNIPWHTDCGLGGHPVICPSLAIGVQLTAASAELGRLEAVAGSHGQTCRYGLDGDTTGLPVVGVDTEPGDVTVHYADVTHASPPPTGRGGRRVLYVTWYNPAVLDFVAPGKAVNDLVRERQAQADALVNR